jgi:hypothetical protein
MIATDTSMWISFLERSVGKTSMLAKAPGTGGRASCYEIPFDYLGCAEKTCGLAPHNPNQMSLGMSRKKRDPKNAESEGHIAA